MSWFLRLNDRWQSQRDFFSFSTAFTAPVPVCFLEKIYFYTISSLCLFCLRLPLIGMRLSVLPFPCMWVSIYWFSYSTSGLSRRILALYTTFFCVSIYILDLVGSIAIWSISIIVIIHYIFRFLSILTLSPFVSFFEVFICL